MRGVLIGGFATMAAAAFGWISYGHLCVFLGAEILTALWFSRQRVLLSRGPVRNPHAKRQEYTVTVDGKTETRVFDPVQGQPLTEEERRYLARNNPIVLGAGGAIAILLGVLSDPSFFTPVKLLSMAVLAGFMVADEYRHHERWLALDAARVADPTVQDHWEYWRVLVFVLFGAILAVLEDDPELQTYAFAVVLLGMDLALHGQREKWSGLAQVLGPPPGPPPGPPTGPPPGPWPSGPPPGPPESWPGPYAGPPTPPPPGPPAPPAP